MNIEVRNVQYDARLSEETMCYSADIYVDGQKLGDAKNRGNGGSTLIYPNLLRQRIEEYAKTLPDAASFEAAESLIDGLVSKELNRRDFRKMIKTKVLITKPDGKLYEIAVRKGEDLTAVAQRVAADKRVSAAYILNLMGEEEAFTIFEKAAGA